MIIAGTFPQKRPARAPVVAPEPEVRGGADLPQPRSGDAETDEDEGTDDSPGSPRPDPLP